MDLNLNKYAVEQGIWFARNFDCKVYFTKWKDGIDWHSEKYFTNEKRKRNLICSYDPTIDNLVDVIIKLFNLKQ